VAHLTQLHGDFIVSALLPWLVLQAGPSLVYLQFEVPGAWAAWRLWKR
jgi:hypothetical protein